MIQVSLLIFSNIVICHDISENINMQKFWRNILWYDIFWYIDVVYASYHIDISEYIISYDISIFLRIYLQFCDFFHDNIAIYLGFDIFWYITSRYIAIFRDISGYIESYIDMSRYIWLNLPNYPPPSAKLEIIWQKSLQKLLNLNSFGRLQTWRDQSQEVRIRR